jgi:hypothetical protein
MEAVRAIIYPVAEEKGLEMRLCRRPPTITAWASRWRWAACC